jgi:cytochrome c553
MRIATIHAAHLGPGVHIRYPAADQKTISQDCSLCHQMVAVDETSPDILKTLELTPNTKPLRRFTMRTLLIVLSFAATLQAADAKAGKAAYDKSCKSCHGPDGTANPAMAKMFKVDIKDLKSSDVQAMSDDDFKMIIMNGKGKMKPVSSVSGAAADNVVAYIRSLK